MSKMSDMMDKHLELPTEETIGRRIYNYSILRGFKRSMGWERGYRGPGMCKMCSARIQVNEENWCAYYAKKCNGIAGSCSGTR